MSLPAVPPAALPEIAVYRVDISESEVLARLAAAEDVAMVRHFPPRSRTDRHFLAMATPRGFCVVQNVGQSTLDGGPPIVRRFFLEATAIPQADGAEIRAVFVRGPQVRLLHYLVLWGATLAWLLTTGITDGKLGLVAIFFALTIPASIHERRKAAGTREDRIELLNLMERILGPASIGESPAERTPYRDGHPPLPAGDKL